MDGVDKIISSLATLFWPCIFLFIIYYFRDQLKGIFASIKELEVGGAKLSFGQAADQLNKELADLRNEFNKFKLSLEQQNLPTSQPPVWGSSQTFGRGAEASPSVEVDNVGEQPLSAPSVGKGVIQNILWVDDNPSNNAFIVKELNDSGVNVTSVTSTLDGVKAFNSKHYDLIISDMGRAEGEVVNYKAGVVLVKQIREVDKSVPIAIYCSSRARNAHGKAALEAGANIVVSSTTQLMAFIHQFTL